MIVSYEKAFVEWLYSFDKSIRDVMFSDEEDILLSNYPMLRYPSVIFSREATDFTATYLPVVIGKFKVRFQPVHQVYHGKIILEKQEQALNFATKLRFYWDNHPYLSVPFDNEEIPVGLRLLYIRVESERDDLQTKGAKRVVKFSWFSDLFMNSATEYPRYKGFRIILDAQDEKIKLLEKYE